MTGNLERRIDRQIAALSEAEKQKLLAENIGPLLPGHQPDADDDAQYLRGIIGGMLRDHDAQVEAIKSSGLAKLERRLAALEKTLGPKGNHLLDLMAESFAKALPKLLAGRGYMKHRGTWTEDQPYTKGDCIVDGGGTWLAVADVPVGARPGKALEWRLVAKGEGKP